MILYHNNMSSCAQKVRLVLAEKGLDWESKHLNLRNGDQHKEDYLKLNSAGVVPTLVHDDNVIVESSIICEYLDDLVPTPRLRPDSPFDLAKMRLWFRMIDSSIHAHAGVVSSAIAFRFQKLAKGEEAASKLVEGIPDENKRNRMRSIVFEGVESPIFGKSLRAFQDLIAKMEKALGEYEYLAGDKFSIADIVCLPYIVRLDQLGLSGIWDVSSNLSNWYSKMTAMKSYGVAFTQWDDPKYLELMAEKGREYWP
ncbi:MAG: glutathione S-transferase family protein, partial [Desulfobulbia bacterium]